MKTNRRTRLTTIVFWRRLVQFSVLAAIFVIPWMNVHKIYFAKGTFYSLDVGDIAVADPVAVFQVMLTSALISSAMLASLVVPLLLMLILGRVWCSWLCPYYLFSDLIAGMRRRLGLRAVPTNARLQSASRANIFRYGFLLAGLLVVGIAGVPLLTLILPPGLISSQALVLVKFGTLTFEIAIILTLLMVEAFYAPRFWCRLFCPTGTCLSFFKTERGMHITLDDAKCSQCGQCAKVCPMGLDPRTEGNNALCHNCGDCIDHCPAAQRGKSLCFGFGSEPGK
ncbi:4Fe-4S binding protein [Chrysiogenes arsenatis]|uniref:4Fe-4S binding protein n=1 Tax=Chrysiogenes arsenatis TaxID=309797 RepID=UPI0003FC9EDA|nr:4Fe-4S binding protein [Chrysiogenes arsenatis]